MSMKQQSNEQLTGIIFGTAAYLIWGVLPIYWKLMDQVPANQILAHRFVWSFVFMVLVLVVSGNVKGFCMELKQITAQPKTLIGVVTAALLISVNWGVFIWAVNSDRIIETSLGYYINPLINVLLGVIVLKERLSFWQTVSFCLAIIGVLNMTLHFGAVPWVALILAITFGLYGLSKKTVKVTAATGITLETLIITPFALLFLTYVHRTGAGAFSLSSPTMAGLLMGAGVATAVPLLLFASGANRLPLYVVGFLQYIAPTISLFIGIFLYHERFTGVHLVSFAFIWAALTVFSLARTRPLVQIENMFMKKMSVKNRETF
ncbi:RarD protein, DMT superfamily transporter [Desulfotomaculum nigrificans CO-1-SRB]|uniref:RarD protein, DMT superfamily transporter n=1 Tax=Desulfotomaculum nigrificans (strain DSM 14880 / VKM B-2319 / CO-1-SRB) TaxID=868595 RepID=F6BA22_DESCC|nr:EamA family transporter RarD [Desulfotomaculum nigrificans]AEF94991.1 RarD protein, DMT superfamily transporter [Desulfotomaculum nigrificans CO-1-SRB]